MADPLYDLLEPQLPLQDQHDESSEAKPRPPEQSIKYLSRLLSLRLADLTTTEPQSIAQSSQSNLLSLQALSARSHRTITLSSDHLSTLKELLPHISNSTKEVRTSIPALDESAVTFASTYSRSRDTENAALTARKEAQLLARQADKIQDILELPSLLSAAIASAGSGVVGSTNYSQALDLFAHIKRLQIIFPDSQLVKSILSEAEAAMKDMTTNLLTSLRNQNIRLAAAIRTIGWLRRVVPELSNTQHVRASPPKNITPSKTAPTSVTNTSSTADLTQSEGSFGALFLTARLATFLTMTEALAPLRELADQELDRRLQQQQQQQQQQSSSISSTTSENSSKNSHPSSVNATNTTTNSSSNSTTGHQTERYLKRYIEIFREQSFSTISMYRNIFPTTPESTETPPLLPPALQTFPLHMVEILFETLKIYFPNITDSAARESLLMQVLYAANSLGRLGADFSMMIALLEIELRVESHADDIKQEVHNSADDSNANAGSKPEEDSDGRKSEEIKEAVQEAAGENKGIQTKLNPSQPEPEWLRIIKKHRVQSAKLDAMAAG